MFGYFFGKLLWEGSKAIVILVYFSVALCIGAVVYLVFGTIMFTIWGIGKLSRFITERTRADDGQD